MGSALEKAARALAAHFGCDWETMHESDREMIRGYARAVLMAVRDEYKESDDGFMRDMAEGLSDILNEETK